MEQNKTAFEYFFAKGQEGEEEVAKYLTNRYYILALYQFELSASAPVIVGKDQSIISPDLVCFRNGTTTFVEVKTKERWVNYYCKNASNEQDKINYLETGCNKEHYEKYKLLSELTNNKLYIIFNHKNNNNGPNGFFYTDILVKGRYWDGVNEKTNTIVSKPLYLWKYKDLKKINIF